MYVWVRLGAGLGLPCFGNCIAFCFYHWANYTVWGSADYDPNSSDSDSYGPPGNGGEDKNDESAEDGWSWELVRAEDGVPPAGGGAAE